jgi:WD40 repeat protein
MLVFSVLGIWRSNLETARGLAARDRADKLFEVGRELALKGDRGALPYLSAAYSLDPRTSSRLVLARALRRLDGLRTDIQFAGPQGASAKVVFSPDGTRVAWVGQDGEVVIKALSWPEEAVRLGPEGVHPSVLVFSPDGTVVATIGGVRATDPQTIRVWDSRTGRLLVTLVEDSAVEHLALNSNSSEILSVSGGPPYARRWSVGTAKPISFGPGGVDVADFTPDGRRIVIITKSHDQEIRVYDSRTLDELYVLHEPEGIWSSALSPDGRWIAMATARGSLRVRDLESGAVVTSFDRGLLGDVAADHAGFLRRPRFSRDGSRILVVASSCFGGGCAESVVVGNASTGMIEAWARGHFDSIHRADFSPDGSFVITASSDETARIWDSRTGAELVVFAEESRSAMLDAQFSSDGERALTRAANGSIRVLDVRLENRSPDVVARMVHCRVSLLLEGLELRTMTPDPVVCAPSSTPDVASP